jgi:hypothetical protein
MSFDLTSSALPPISQDFSRPSLSDTRRPATSAGIVQLGGAGSLPGTNSLGGQGALLAQQQQHQIQHQQAGNGDADYTGSSNGLTAPPGMLGMRLHTGHGTGNGGYRTFNGGGTISYDPARRSSLGLVSIDENGLISSAANGSSAAAGTKHIHPSTSNGNHGMNHSSTNNAGPPGSAGGMSNPGSILRRESDANYAGVFAHTVEDANNHISSEDASGRREQPSAPTFNNPFPTPANPILDPNLSTSRPSSQHQQQRHHTSQQQSVRFQSPAEPHHAGLGDTSSAWAASAPYRRASEPHYKHAPSSYPNLPNPAALYSSINMGNYPSAPAGNGGGLNMRDLHIGNHADRQDMPASAPAFTPSFNQPSPTSAAGFGSAPDPRTMNYASYGGNNNSYPHPSHMQQWQYGYQQGGSIGQQRRRSTQGATTGYHADSPIHTSDGSRRPSVVEGNHDVMSSYAQHAGRHSIGGMIPSGGQGWSGFPMDYRFGDVPGGAGQHRSSVSGASSAMGAAMQAAAGFAMGAYPSSNAGFGQGYHPVDLRNNSYSTGSTQSRQSFDARRSNGHISDQMRRDSNASLGSYSGDDGNHDPASGPSVKKRPRRRFDQIERLYPCRWDGCDKAYGTLNHLNAHVSMQKHGQKRKPEGQFRITSSSVCD